MSNIMKIRPAGAELFDSDRWTDRRTDITKLTVAFRKFAITLQNDGFSIKTFKRKLFFSLQRTNFIFKTNVG